MRVLLIDPPGWQEHAYNLGLAHLAASLARAGHEARVADGPFAEEDRLRAFARQWRPEVVGVSAKSALYHRAVGLLEAARAEAPDALALFGGPHPSVAAAECLGELPEGVGVFNGEAEEALPEVCARRAGGERLPGAEGLAYAGPDAAAPRAAKVADLDALPPPDLDLFLAPKRRFTYQLLTSRGCPYDCSFCSVPTIAGRSWRTRSLDLVIEELRGARARWGADRFEIDDDNFTLDLDRAKRFCRALLESGLRMAWSCPNGLRVEHVDRELALLMKRAGCFAVSLGIESASAEVLEANRKGETPEQIEAAVRRFREAGVAVTGFFILGLPGATLERDLESLDLAERLGLDHAIFNRFVPYPGTSGWDALGARGVAVGEYRGRYHFGPWAGEGDAFLFETPEYPRAERERAARVALERPERGAANVARRLDEDARRVLVMDVEPFPPLSPRLGGLGAGREVAVLRVHQEGEAEWADGAGGARALPAPFGAAGKARFLLAWARLAAATRYDAVLAPEIGGYRLLALCARARARYAYSAQFALRPLGGVDALLGSRAGDGLRQLLALPGLRGLAAGISALVFAALAAAPARRRAGAAR